MKQSFSNVLHCYFKGPFCKKKAQPAVYYFWFWGELSFYSVSIKWILTINMFILTRSFRRTSAHCWCQSTPTKSWTSTIRNRWKHTWASTFLSFHLTCEWTNRVNFSTFVWLEEALDCNLKLPCFPTATPWQTTPTKPCWRSSTITSSSSPARAERGRRRPPRRFCSITLSAVRAPLFSTPSGTKCSCPTPS